MKIKEKLIGAKDKIKGALTKDKLKGRLTNTFNTVRGRNGRKAQIAAGVAIVAAGLAVTFAAAAAPLAAGIWALDTVLWGGLSAHSAKNDKKAKQTLAA